MYNLVSGTFLVVVVVSCRHFLLLALLKVCAGLLITIHPDYDCSGS